MRTLLRESAIANGILAVGWAGLIFYMSGRSVSTEPITWLPPFTDKVAHFLIYAILAFLVFRALYLGGFASFAAVILAFILTSLYGLTDEWHQASVPGRDSDLYDWVADTLGAATVMIWSRSVK